MKSTEKFVHDLLEIAPELSTLHADHLDAYETLLPHVWMGDFSQYLIELNERIDAQAGSNEKTTLNELIEFLELQLKTGSEEVKNVIGVSFLENIAHYAVVTPSFRTRLGKTLDSELEAMLQWRPSEPLY